MSGFAASPAQRRKVAGLGCLVCMARPVDPAHVTSRAQGGCDAPECVVPLCRRHHSELDEGRLDVLPLLEPRFRKELGHAVEHRGLLATLYRVTNELWAPVRELAA